MERIAILMLSSHGLPHINNVRSIYPPHVLARTRRIKPCTTASGTANPTLGPAIEDVSHVLGPLRWLAQTHTD